MENLDFNSAEVENIDFDSTPPETLGSSSTIAIKTPKEGSEVWKYFERVPTGDHCPKHKNLPIFKAICRTCNRALKGSSWDGTSSLRKHYENHVKVLNKSQTSISQDPNSGEIINFRFSAAVARKELVSYIQTAHQPFGFAENPHFVKMIQKAFQPGYTGISRNTCRNEIMKDFRKGKNDLISFFKNFDGKVSLTSDFWSSNQKLDYVCFTAHFIDSDWVLQKRIIAFKLAEIPHNGVVVGNEIFNVLKDFQLEKKLLSISLDNASYYTNAIEYLACDLNIPSDSIESRLLHVRCCAHIVNLIVHEGLDIISPSVNKIRSLVTYVKSSNKRVKIWKESCSAKGKKELMLISEVATRWNSCYHMLERAYEYKDVVSFYLNRFEKHYEGKPSEIDWINCQIYQDFLKVFDDVTLTLSSVYTPTSNLVFLELMKIAMLFQKYQSAIDYEKKYKAAITVMKDKFFKYWKTFPIVFGIATILDPRFKGRGLEKMLSFIYGVEDGKKQYDHIMLVAKDIFVGYKVQSPSISRANDDIPLSSSTDCVWDFFKRQKTNSGTESELEIYLQRAEERSEKDMNILEWWKKESGSSKSLANMARDFLSVQASTTVSERAFSTSGRLISDYRSCLKPDIIEACMCNEDWINARGRTQEELIQRRVKEDEMILNMCEDTVEDLTLNN